MDERQKTNISYINLMNFYWGIADSKICFVVTTIQPYNNNLIEIEIVKKLFNV